MEELTETTEESAYIRGRQTMAMEMVRLAIYELQGEELDAARLAYERHHALSLLRAGTLERGLGADWNEKTFLTDMVSWILDHI